MNLMLINVSTRKLRRAVRLPEGDVPIMAGDGTSKSAASRRFVALSAERLAKWMAPMPHSISHSDACLRLFNKKWGIPDHYTLV